MPKIEEPDPPITAAEYEAFVGRTGMVPPEDYRAFILAQNGGLPVENVYVRKDGEIEHEFTVHQFYGIENGDLTVGDILENFRLLERPPHLFPFACDEGGNHYCFNMQDNASVVLLYTDGSESDTLPVASSFKQFLDNLQDGQAVQYDF